jgi:hypothetical protein
MGACLVQQLFRQKVHIELDPRLVDEVIFPMLRSRKHPSRELLQDIKLTSDTLIITDYARREARHFSVPSFTPIPEYWTYVAPWREKWRADLPPRAKVGAYPPVGKRTSKVRRGKISNQDWGTIDILNELRRLNYPQVGYSCLEYPGDEFDDGYIRLAEDNSLPANIRWGVDHSRENAVLIDSRSQFVKNFLDDILITDKRLTWGASTPWGVLSIVESYQYGEVQRQLYTAGGGSSRR